MCLLKCWQSANPVITILPQEMLDLLGILVKLVISEILGILDKLDIFDVLDILAMLDILYKH